MSQLNTDFLSVFISEICEHIYFYYRETIKYSSVRFKSRQLIFTQQFPGIMKN